jgi:peptidyl-prolyl cis-trans isomerase C
MWGQFRFLHNMKKIIFLLVLFGLTGCNSCNKTKSREKPDVLNIKIDLQLQRFDKDLFDLAVKAATPPGQQPNAALENDVRQRLINIELLAQDAIKQGLDKTAENQIRIHELRQNLLAELLLADYFTKNPITEDMLRDQYSKELQSLGGNSLEQYRLSVIALPTEAEAASTIAQIKSGEAFGKVAKQKSIDPSKEQSGQAGWVLPAQVNPSIALVMTNLPKGGMSSTPVQTPNGWYIIKVEEKRPFKAPSFDETKNQIRANLVQQKQAEIIIALREKAKITQ